MNVWVVFAILFAILFGSVWLLIYCFLKLAVVLPSKSGLTWKVNDTNRIDAVVQEVLDANGIAKTIGSDWDLYVPSTYDNLAQQLAKITEFGPQRKVFAMDNADQLCGKNLVWTNLVGAYSRSGAAELMPNTYVLHNADDMELFKKEYDPRKLYILKKNIQKQEGLLITREYTKILNAATENYVVVQELLQNPFLINERKINMRFYLLIVCDNGMIPPAAYVFNDGFMYYTKDPFVPDSTAPGPNITTGYIDRQVYVDNPLTHSDFKKYLLEHNKKPNKFFCKTNESIAKVVNACANGLCQGSLKECISFQLFGVDIAVSDDLQPLLMEVNKGPDLGAKDQRDKQLKLKALSDAFAIVGLVKSGSANGYVRIL